MRYAPDWFPREADFRQSRLIEKQVLQTRIVGQSRYAAHRGATTAYNPKLSEGIRRNYGQIICIWSARAECVQCAAVGRIVAPHECDRCAPTCRDMHIDGCGSANESNSTWYRGEKLLVASVASNRSRSGGHIEMIRRIRSEIGESD